MIMGYSPELSQVLYRIGESVTNTISPMMSFFALIIAFFQKYDPKTGIGTIVFAPMTTSSKKYPTRIEIKYNDKVGWIVVDQIRTIEKKRIIKSLGRLSKPEIKEVKSIIKETYVD